MKLQGVVLNLKPDTLKQTVQNLSGRHREIAHHFQYLLLCLMLQLCVARIVCNRRNPAPDLLKLFYLSPPVVAAGVPRRMPLVTNAGAWGQRGSCFCCSAIQHDRAHAPRFCL